MRIGEILIRHRFVDAADVEQALADQRARPGHQRLVSMLIAQGLLDPDNGAVALAEQLGYPAALTRHLELRTAALSKTVTPATCRSWCAIPIARTPTRALIVCTRDPSPALLQVLLEETGGAIELAVTPAILIERLVRATCGGAAAPRSPSPSGSIYRPGRPATISSLLAVRTPGTASAASPVLRATTSKPVPAKRGTTDAALKRPTGEEWSPGAVRKAPAATGDSGPIPTKRKPV